MAKKEYSGECLCGSCRYEIEAADSVRMYLCHCSRCRKETGTVHGANIFLRERNIIWVRGQEMLAHYRYKETEHERVFCRVCGSPMPRNTGDGDIVLPAGSLDDDSFVEPTAHIFYSDGASWREKVPGIPKFDELPEV